MEFYERDDIMNVTQYRFRDVIKPKVTPGHDGCLKIITSIKGGKCKYMKVWGTDQEVFLKKLDKVSLVEGDTSFIRENTIVVDKSLYKHVFNNLDNVLLLDSWTEMGNGKNVGFLLQVLLPWLRGLHNSIGLGLSNF